VKHFAVYQQESRRFNIDAKVDERTLREIYLKPFEMVVKNARPWAVMSSYNYLNGTHVDMQKRLLTSILRDEWGFQGLVMSDWGGTNSTAESLAAGLDLEMPGPPVRRGERLLQSLSEGKADLDTIDKSVRNVLCTIASAHLIGANDNESKNHSINIDLSAQRKLLHEAAVNGTVLLRNNGILPLDRKKIEKLAIIGPNAKTPTVGGSGSAALNPYDISTPYDACAATARAENPDIKISFEQGILRNKLCPLIPTILLSENLRDPGVRIDFYE
jgi:beta-glucosidase